MKLTKKILAVVLSVLFVVGRICRLFFKRRKYKGYNN